MLYQRRRDGKPLGRITGRFTALIVLDERERGRAQDADNRIKAVLDFAQRIEIIDNDKLADETTVRWGEAPHGCVLYLRPSA